LVLPVLLLVLPVLLTLLVLPVPLVLPVLLTLLVLPVPLALPSSVAADDAGDEELMVEGDEASWVLFVAFLAAATAAWLASKDPSSTPAVRSDV
jgi:hypothetical protein